MYDKFYLAALVKNSFYVPFVLKQSHQLNQTTADPKSPKLWKLPTHGDALTHSPTFDGLPFGLDTFKMTEERSFVATNVT